jgi:hypothetical protein
MNKSIFFLQTFFLVSFINLQAQTQIGADIDGEAAGDLSGLSVSLSSDGSVKAIGAPFNYGVNGLNSGSVRLYKNTGGSWVQIGTDIDGEAVYDQSGHSVSLSSDGSVVAIGAIYNNGNGTSSGSVRLYKNTSGTWVQIGGDINGEAANDQSGSSVSLSSDGSVVAIGALGNDENGTSSGSVRLYKNTSGSWAQIGADIDGEAANDYSGASVSLSSDGTVVAIGAPNNDGNGSDSGSVRLYKNIGGTWAQIGADIDGEAAGDESGTSVSLSSDGAVVAIGALGNDENGSDSGSVRLYKNTGGTWVQIGEDIDGELAGDQSGTSVSLSSDGSVVAIGAANNDGNGTNSGSVRLYKNTSGSWVKIGADIDGEAAGDYSGASVSLSSDGSVVAIGAPFNYGVNGSNSGSVRLYKYTNDTWTQIGADIDGEAARDNSGESVSLSSDGSVVAIGATYNDGNGSYSGSVRLYKNTSGSWVQIGADIDGEAVEDLSGTSVSLSSDGSVVAIGALGNDGNGTRSGSVRLYKNTNGTWAQIGADIDGERSVDYSGESVSLSSDGSVVAIGASFNDGRPYESGHVRVYKNTGGTWAQIGADIDGEAAYNYSGRSVSLSSDGSVVAIGAPYNDGNGDESGHVRVYKNTSGSWVKIGGDIDGEAANDYSGSSVSLSSDGSVVAIGAPYNDGNSADSNFNSGSVRLYKNTGGTWAQIGADIDGEAANDQSGRSVSLSSDGAVVAIGALGNDENGSDSGSVRLYKNTSDTWTKIGADIDGEAAGDQSGKSVSLSSDGAVVAIGAFENDGNGTNSGSVRVYKNPNYVKTQIGADIDGEAAGDYSGWSVSLSSDGAVKAIGAPFNDENGANSGSVRLYKNTEGTWAQIGGNIDGEAAGDQSGYSVSLSSDGAVVAIGAIYNDENGTDSGSVCLYKNIGGTWAQIGTDIDGEAAEDRSGYSVSLSSDGSVVAIGAAKNDGNGSNSGSVRLYKNTGGTWVQIGEDINGEAAGDQSGNSVSLSSDGSVVAIGAANNDGNGTNSGSVRLYKNTSGSWVKIGADIYGEAAGDYSGASVSLSSDGSVVAIGALFNDGNGVNSGSVRLYKNTGTNWVQIGTEIDGETANDYSGFSVSLSSDGSVVAIGAPYNDGNGANSGSVRLYKNIDNIWVKIDTDIDGEAAGDQSGWSVSLSSDGAVVAIGTPYNDGNGTDSGTVSVQVTGHVIWQGDDNTDWENSYNWSNNSIPKSNAYVVIPSGSERYPTATKTISANTIEINNGASFMADYFVNAAVNYKRDIATSDWYMVSSPVAGQDIDVFASATSLAVGGIGNNRGLAPYNNATPGWDYYQSGATGSGNFSLGTGYSIKLTAASTLNYRGTMATINKAVTINNADNAFNLVGNPYPSFIAINANAINATENLLTVNKALPDAAAVLEEATLWCWDQSNGYKAVNLASTDVTYIAPGQGFFVKTSATTGNTTSLSFTKAMQSHQTTDTFLKATNNRTEIKLKVSQNGSAKETEIFYITETTTGFDNGYDSSIFEGVSASLELFTGLVTGSVDKKLAIQSLPDSNFDAMVIPIGLIAPAGEVTFSANATNLPSEANKVFIEDKELGVFKRLDDASMYTVTLTEASTTSGRFFLHVRSAVLSVPNENVTALNMYYVANSKELHIKGLLEEEGIVEVYNVMGKNVFSTKFTPKANTSLVLPNLSTGVYIVQLRDKSNGNWTKKIVVE